jgi:hypothetical protein
MVTTFDFSKLDITKTNAAVDRLLEETTNPRHRHLLQAYGRHRNLEMAGRYEEIFAPDMTVDRPIYRFNYSGLNTTLEGPAVRSLYRLWTQTNQTAFYAESEEVAVADHFICSTVVAYQQVWGKAIRLNAKLRHLPRFVSEHVLKIVLAQNPGKVSDDDMYLLRTKAHMIWPYDDRCRLIGEDVWELEPGNAQLIKLDPQYVLKPQDAAERLGRYIKPLPPLDGSFAS